MLNMLDTLNLSPEYQAQYEAFLQEFAKNIDPTDYMAPSLREVARMDMDTLKAEFELVQQKQSTRSSAQRRWITERYEYESNKPQEQDGSES